MKAICWIGFLFNFTVVGKLVVAGMDGYYGCTFIKKLLRREGTQYSSPLISSQSILIITGSVIKYESHMVQTTIAVINY